ncbi:MAG TPA: DUF721 domain-containing protein [Candidatus Acidoferrales bacterium]|nr:DUF721 domain-containing protein [Candidatus Acidoferrales bacterium]
MDCHLVKIMSSLTISQIECGTPQCVRIANSMERAGEFLSAALRRMKDPEAARTWLKATWPKLVGDAMAAHIRPSAYAKGVLRIEADSREWQKQTESMNQEICERVNRSWGSHLVNEIRVEPAQHGGRRLAYEVDNNHIPFVRRPMSTRKP